MEQPPSILLPARQEDLRSLPPRAFVLASFLAGYRDPTRTNYANNMKNYFDWCDRRGVDVLSMERAQIELYLRWMEEVKGLKLSTIAGQIGTIHLFYQHAVIDKYLQGNPAEYVKRPRVPRVSTTNYLTRSELLSVLDLAQKTRPRDHALVCILGLNGLRIGEVVQMNIDDLGRQGGYVTLRVHREKGGRTPLIPLAPRTSWAVEQTIFGRTEGPIFLSREGTRLDKPGANRVVKRLCKEVGITKRISCHSFRHTFITLALDAGVSLRDVQHSVGHSDSRQVSYYDRNRESLPRNATHFVHAFVEGS